MKKTAREAAALALLSVMEQGGYSNLVLDNIMDAEDLSREDRSFCAALLYTTVQHSLTLDYAIAAHSSQPPKKLSKTVLCCLRLGFCQLLYMDSVPPNAAVNETVELCKRMGEEHAARFVNGVLRGFIRSGMNIPTPKDALTALSVRHSVPMPLIQLWRKSYGHAAALAILEGLEAPPPVFLRVNRQRTTSDDLCKLLAEEGLSAVPVPGVPDALELAAIPGGVARLQSFRGGLFHVQDLSSQRCCHAAFADGFAPKKILDLCAAPGGKSFTTYQLAAERQENPTLAARDLYPARAELVRQGTERLGLDGITAMQGDATVFDPTVGLFDLVLCDVVCSGFGILRRKPEIRYKELKLLDELPDLQYTILNIAADYCADGGRLVYSTCTLSPHENTEVVNRFLESHPQFAAAHPPVTMLPGRTAPPDQSGLTSGNGGDGFFYTVLQHR